MSASAPDRRLGAGRDAEGGRAIRRPDRPVLAPSALGCPSWICPRCIRFRAGLRVPATAAPHTRGSGCATVTGFAAWTPGGAVQTSSVPGPFADEQLTAFVAQPSPPFAQLDVAAIREGIAQRARERSRGPEMQAVHELRIGALPARVYRPAAGRIPLVVYLHGGGGRSAILSPTTGCAGGWRMARVPRSSRSTTGLRPEHPWPASVDDTVAALRWVASAPVSLGRHRARWPSRVTAPAAPWPRWPASPARRVPAGTAPPAGAALCQHRPHRHPAVDAREGGPLGPGRQHGAVLQLPMGARSSAMV